MTIIFLFFFLPIAFSKIPLSVAPDLVAPSPNLAIKDFSSSIWAAFTDSFILLVFESNSVIFASKALPGENTSGLASATSFARSIFLIVTISFFSLSNVTLTPVFKTSWILVVMILPIFFPLSLNQSKGSLSNARFENLILSSLIYLFTLW